jgi:glycosyltransferase involved in cell wall biosynthesis
MNIRIAAITPIFRHSVLVSEAIESVLAQKAPFDIHIVLINDGCKFIETDQICREYALAYPDRITYIRKSNGGLSDARNHGIRHALEKFPTLDAIYMLDADNRLRPHALARAMQELDQHPEADWVYPNIDMFGLTKWEGDYGGDFGGDYSLLIHSNMNICEAGSLIRTRVFKSGIFFDTEFKQGWEDWDFFLTAAESGFCGRNLENFGFLYRKRPESMLADSTREKGTLASAIKMKHKALMTPTTQVSLEHKECPRYAIHLQDLQEVIFCTDPTAGKPVQISVSEFIFKYWQATSIPGRYTLPAFIFSMHSKLFFCLKNAGLIHWVIWQLEVSISTSASIALLTAFPASNDRIGFSEHIDGKNFRDQSIAIATTMELFNKILKDRSLDWINPLTAPDCQPPLSALELGLPLNFIRENGLDQFTALHDFLSLILLIQNSSYRDAAMQHWDWRTAGIPIRNTTQNISRQAFSGAIPYPRIRDGKIHVAFLLPIVEFGGVEKVALQIAKALKAHGLVPHLIVLEARDCAFSEEWRSTFESVAFLGDPSFKTWEDGQSYYGTTISQWALDDSRHNKFLGMTHWCSAIINLHGGAINGAIGALRKIGIKTVLSLHLHDLDRLGRPVGNTYLGLAYEHAYDIIAPCSYQLGDWLHAMGVPQDKICVIQNAPGFDTPEDQLAITREARLARSGEEPLHALYIGRLDRQKGLDRLTDVIQQTKLRNMNIAWRVIGKAVIADAELPAVFEDILEDAINKPEELAEAYAWADVVVLLSSYEGLPLTVLEAMRAGTVMIATDVGATAEVLQHGINGILLNPKNSVNECLDALDKISKDRNLFRKLSIGAIDAAKTHNWMDSTLNLINTLGFTQNNIHQ